MTDEQIVMLMERCYKKEESVVIVQFNSDDTKTEITLDDILGVVNRKQAEIERLQTEKENLRCVIEDLSNNTEHAKAEAIKEFAERLNAYLHQDDFGTPDERWKPESEFAILIDNLAKEMAGEG